MNWLGIQKEGSLVSLNVARVDGAALVVGMGVYKALQGLGFQIHKKDPEYCMVSLEDEPLPRSQRRNTLKLYK